jgi:hemerythrin superfamily protein
MAIVNSIFKPTGSIEGFSFYTVAGSDKVIMRKKGGPKKARIATGKEFEKLRKHQEEWSGCVLFSRKVCTAVGDLYTLRDMNLSSVWTGMGKKLMGLDTNNEIGKRAVQLSLYKQALVDFNFCRKKPLISLLRLVPEFETDREKMKAAVRYPRINTAEDLVNSGKLPYFRIVASLGCVSDLKFEKSLFSNYVELNDELNGVCISEVSNWLSTNDIIENQELTIEYEDKFQKLLTPEVSLILGVGIEFGAVGFGGKIEAVKRSGAAKIVAVL